MGAAVHILISRMLSDHESDASSENEQTHAHTQTEMRLDVVVCTNRAIEHVCLLVGQLFFFFLFSFVYDVGVSFKLRLIEGQKHHRVVKKTNIQVHNQELCLLRNLLLPPWGLFYFL